MKYFVYILASKKNGTLYVGLTNQLARRIQEHKDKLVPGFTKKYGVQNLVYYESFDYINDAIRREKNIKAWKRDWKIRIIEEMNPTWKDLAHDI